MQATEGTWTITRKVTEQVTTIGIDIGKNTFHLIGLDGRLGSIVPVHRGSQLRPDLKAQRKESVRIGTSRPEGPKLKAKRTCIGHGRDGEK